MIPFFSGDDVRAAVAPERAVEAVRDAFVAYARGEWTMPPKVYVPAYPAGDFRAMPALGADLHRAELHQLEFLAVQADASLPVEDGTAVLELDRNGRDRKRGTRDREPEAGQRGVDDAVHRVPSAFAQTAGTPKRR